MVLRSAGKNISNVHRNCSYCYNWIRARKSFESFFTNRTIKKNCVNEQSHFLSVDGFSFKTVGNRAPAGWKMSNNDVQYTRRLMWRFCWQYFFFMCRPTINKPVRYARRRLRSLNEQKILLLFFIYKYHTNNKKKIYKTF